MINYSIYPGEIIFAEWDDYQPEYSEVTIEGITLMVEKVTENQYKIEKIISSDPSLFLRKDMQPGTMLKSSFYF